MEFLYVLAIVLVVLLISFPLINLRNVVTGKEFRGTCASNNPYLKDQLGDCKLCGKKADEVCKMPEVEQKA